MTPGVDVLRKLAREHHRVHGPSTTRCVCVCGLGNGGPAGTPACQELLQVTNALDNDATQREALAELVRDLRTERDAAVAERDALQRQLRGGTTHARPPERIVFQWFGSVQHRALVAREATIRRVSMGTVVRLALQEYWGLSGAWATHHNNKTPKLDRMFNFEVPAEWGPAMEEATRTEGIRLSEAITEAVVDYLEGESDN